MCAAHVHTVSESRVRFWSPVSSESYSILKAKLNVYTYMGFDMEIDKTRTTNILVTMSAETSNASLK